jgi:large subunit ribosomal protein L23
MSIAKSAYQIIRRPIITEKGMMAREADPKAKHGAKSGQLVFEVASDATKTEIKEAVQKVFKVKVDSVQTANFYGKERRRGKFAGKRADWKKAYVRLKLGEKMPDYAEGV